MASKKQSEDEKPGHPGPSSIEEIPDEEDLVTERISCYPWKRGRQKQAVIDAQKTTIGRLKGEKARLQQRWQDERRQSKHQVQLLTERENENTEKEEQWREEREQSQKEKDKLQQQVEQLKGKKKELEKDNKQWQEDLQQCQKEKDKLQQQVEQLKGEKKELEKDNKQWQEDLQQCQQQVQQLETEKTELEEKNKEKEKRWQEERQQSQEEKDRLQQQVQQLKAEKTELEEDNKEREKQWQKELHQCQAERDVLRRERDHWKTKASQCEGEIRRLREDVTAKTAQLADYKHRLSEMASERMRQGNACVEDLNDPFRPTALSDKWTGLFKTGEYWTAYDKAQKALKSEEDAAQFLYNVAKIVWKVCFDFIEDFVPRVLMVGPCSSDLLSTENEKELRQQMLEKLPEVRGKLAELLPQDASRVDDIVKTLEEEYNNVRQTDIPNLQQKLRKAVSRLPKTASPPELLAKKVADALRAEGSLKKDVQVDENFVRKLAGLCYLMRLQEVPLFVSFDFTRGSPLELSMFEVDSNALQSSTGMAIKSILRPPLLRSEGGAVLSKGEADVEPAKPASESKTQDEAQRQDTASEKQNGDETAEPKENEHDEQNDEPRQHESQQNEKAKDSAGETKNDATKEDGTPTVPPSQDGTSDQDEPPEHSANASQTNPDEP